MNLSDDRVRPIRKLLFYSDAKTFGGHEMMAVKAAAGLSRLGLDVGFAIFKDNRRLLAAIEYANQAGGRIRPVLNNHGPLRLHAIQAPFRWGRIWTTHRLFHRERPDTLILVQGRIEAAATAVVGARLGRQRVISYLPMAHSLGVMAVRRWPAFRDAINGLYYRAIDRFAVVSQSVVTDVHRFHPRARCVVVENVVEPPPEHPPDRNFLRGRLGVPAEAVLLGMVGRVSFAQKGHDILLNALAASPGLRNAHLVVVGDGPDLPVLHDLANRLGVGDRLFCVGWATADINAVYASIDVLALPSRYEGVPLVMLEALARRIPVIGTNADGMADWLPAAALFDATSHDDIYRAFRFAKECADAFAPAFNRATGCTDAAHYADDWRRAILSLIDGMGEKRD